jgi:hypothetical protein
MSFFDEPNLGYLIKERESLVEDNYAKTLICALLLSSLEHDMV